MSTEYKIPVPGIIDLKDTLVFQRGNRVVVKVNFKDETLVPSYRENKWNEENSDKKDDLYNFFKMVEIPGDFNKDGVMKFKPGLFTFTVTFKQPRFINIVKDESD